MDKVHENAEEKENIRKRRMVEDIDDGSYDK